MGPSQTHQLGTTMQMSGPSLARTGTLHFTEPERQDTAFERVSQYLEDQSSVAGFSCVAFGSLMQDVRTADWVSLHGSVDGNRRLGSVAVPTPRDRADDCGMPEGCGTEGSPIRFKIDLKPKDPPVFAGKGTYDVEI